MNKLCIMAGASIGSYAGWFLTEQYGMGIAIVVSSITTMVGGYFGWKLARKLDQV